MLKKLGVALAFVAISFGFQGCAAGGGDFIYRGWKHFEWHILGAYKDLVKLHQDVDKFVFNLDERNPDRY